MDNMSLSDIAAVTRNVDGDGWGAGGPGATCFTGYCSLRGTTRQTRRRSR